MKLLCSLIALTSAQMRYCGQMKAKNGHIRDSLDLSESESCLYHIEPVVADTESHFQVSQKLPPCRVAEMYIHQDGQIFGPFCQQKRVRRSGWGTKWSSPLSSKPFDVVYTSHGIKFSFDFEFDLEPGLPQTKSLNPIYTPKPKPDNYSSAFSMKEQILSQIQGLKPGKYPIQVVPSNDSTVKPTKPTFKPTARPFYRPTFKPSHAKPAKPAQTSPAELPKPEVQTDSWTESALDTKETILATLSQENNAFNEKEQIFALAQNLGTSYDVTTSTTVSSTKAPIDMDLIDNIVNQSANSNNNNEFVYQGYNPESYYPTHTEGPATKGDLEVYATTEVDENQTYRLDTTTYQYIEPTEKPVKTPKAPVKPFDRPLPDRELDVVFDRPRPGPGPINLLKPLPPQKPSEQVTTIENFGMQRPNPMAKDHPVPHLPREPLDTKLVVVTQGTTTQGKVVPVGRSVTPSSAAAAFAQSVFEAQVTSDLTIEEVYNGIMQMKFNEKGLLQREITLSRKRGIINRIVKRIERAEKIAALTQKRAEINQKRAERKRARQSRG